MRALLFLIDSVASFFAALFVLRFLMQACRASFGGPVGHFVVTLTNWAVKPLRRVIPGFAGYDWASLLAAYALQLAPVALLFAVSEAMALAGGVPTMLWLALLGLLRLVIYVYIGALIVQAVLSWVNPYSALALPVDQLTRPLLGPIRRVLPPISGIDLSPLVLILLLQVVLMYL